MNDVKTKLVPNVYILVSRNKIKIKSWGGQFNRLVALNDDDDEKIEKGSSGLVGTLDTDERFFLKVEFLLKVAIKN